RALGAARGRGGCSPRERAAPRAVRRAPPRARPVRRPARGDRVPRERPAGRTLGRRDRPRGSSTGRAAPAPARESGRRTAPGRGRRAPRRRGAHRSFRVRVHPGARGSVTTKAELLAAEDAGWSEFRRILTSLSPDQIELTGYFAEGWSVKDLIGHIGAWAAEAHCVLEQIRNDTFEDAPVDVDALNRRFFDANRDLPLPVVQAEAWAARTRMLTELWGLAEVTPRAESWFVESGAEHYAEHLPRLRAWAAELLGTAGNPP